MIYLGLDQGGIQGMGCETCMVSRGLVGMVNLVDEGGYLETDGHVAIKNS